MQRNTFTIDAGIHQGATFAANDTLLVIGADAACDVCLSDAGIAARHAAILSQGSVLSIRRLDGDVSVDGRDIQAACAALAPGADIVLGATGVRLRLGETPARVEMTPTATPARFNRPRAVAIGTLAIVATVIVAAFSVGTLGASQPPSPKIADLAAVRALLEREHLERDIEITASAGQVNLSGVVAADSAEKLRNTLAGLAVQSTVVTDAELLEQVREVFRTSGYEANVAYLGNARVRIDNLDPGHERVRKAAARARTDVAELRELEFSVSASGPPADLPTYPARFAEPLIVHAEEDVAYLSAGSSTRYFIGSQLPDGARIERITTSAVLVDRNGQRAWFAF
jgi:hypothetical protein